MAKIKKQVKTVDKWKKKKWFTLLAPKIFNERPLGETCASSSDILPGRTITSNLMSLTGNIKKQNVNVQFEVYKIVGEKALTHVKKIELVPNFIKRKVRRNRDRIDASFVCKTKDDKYVRVKPMVITLSRSSRATQTALKAKLIDHIVTTLKNQTYDDFINDIINYKFQRNAKQALRKIFPVFDAEMRASILLDATNMRNVKPIELNAKPKEEKVEEPVVEEKTPEVKDAPKEEVKSAA